MLSPRSRIASFLFGVVAAAVVTAAFAQPAIQNARVVTEHDELSVARGVVEFQRGVFRIEPDGMEVTPLCIPVMGVWKRVGKQEDCGNPPPPSQQREITRFPDDVTFLGIRNLGITTEQWGEARKPGKSGVARNALKMVGEAFSFAVGNADVRWRLETAKLPAELKSPIPGAGIAIHFGGNYSEALKPKVFATAGDELQIEVRLALPELALTGTAHTGITMAVDLDVVTVEGNRIGFPVIVNLFHSDPKSREVIRSDGRVNFASTYLGPKAKYVIAVENHQRNTAWHGFERFAFRLTSETIKRVLMDANAYGRKHREDLIDLNRIRDVKISSVTLRNENRFLDKGDVTISVWVDYLRVIRSGPRG